MPTQYIRGANRTAQWYQDDYPGAVFSRIDKFLLHTTETMGWPGYGGGASAPNATYYPRWRRLRQHFGINRSARALRDPSNTVVRENRDNVFQLEIICYSDHSLARRIGGLWVGDLTATHMRDIAAIALQCHRDWGLPLQSSVRWREGRQGYYNDVRLSGSQFDAYRGILGHVHASGNTHWDPGGFRYSMLETAMSWQFANHPVYGSVPWPGADPIDIPDFPEDDVSKEDVREGLLEMFMEAAERSTTGGRHLGDALRTLLKAEFAGILDEASRGLSGDDRDSTKYGRNVRDDLWAILKDPIIRRIDAGTVDPQALAAAVVAELPPEQGQVTQATVEAALREVFGELDETDAAA